MTFLSYERGHWQRRVESPRFLHFLHINHGPLCDLSFGMVFPRNALQPLNDSGAANRPRSEKEIKKIPPFDDADGT